MGLETGTYIDSLVATNPVGATDPKSQGDDHIRLLKSTILATFPNIDGAMTATEDDLNVTAGWVAAGVAVFDDGMDIRIVDAGGTDYVDFAHNGTDLIITGVSTGWVRFRDLASGVIFEDGNEVRVYDSTNGDYLTLSHNGSHGQINTGGTGGGNLQIQADGGQIQFLGGLTVQIWDATTADRMDISHDGTDVDVVFAGTTAIKFRDGIELRVYDSTDSDYIGLKHDGTDAVWTATNVAEMDFASINIKSDNDDAQEPGFKGAPHNEQNGNYTLVLGDAAKRIYKASGGAGETITIPANASVAFPVGTIIHIVNDGGGDLTIAITTDTLEPYGGTAGSQTLPDNHKAVIEKVTATLWKYSATG